MHGTGWKTVGEVKNSPVMVSVIRPLSNSWTREVVHRNIYTMRFTRNYRPHLKDEGMQYFQFVCQSTPGGPHLPTGEWGVGVPPSGLDGGTPSLPIGGGWYPILPDWGGGTPIQSWQEGVPPSSTNGGIPPFFPMGGGVPHQDWMGVPPSCQDWMGITPPSPKSGDRAAERVLATRRVVRLLRSLIHE